MARTHIHLDIHHPDTGAFKLTSKVYKSLLPGKRPAIFMTPIFGGMDYIESTLACLFSMSGMNVFITDFMPPINFNEQIKDLNIHDRTYRRSIVGLEELRHTVGEFSFVDGERLGLFGMSLGGIFTSLNTKANEHFKASVIVAGGGNHHETLAHSKQPVMVALKESRKRLFKLQNDDDYQKLMACHNEMDSFKIFRNVDPAKVLMFISTQDDQVPYSIQLETWHDLGKPEALFLNLPHYRMITTVPFSHFTKIRDFYLEKFYPGGTRGKTIRVA